MPDNFVAQLPLWKWVSENYQNTRSNKFPGGGKVDYVDVFNATHQYLNEKVHPTVQNRAPLQDEGVYLTDHGPRHIEVVMRRASRLVTARDAAVGIDANQPVLYRPCLTPYEAFLLLLSVHFHDVGNMYGRQGHETKVLEVMEQIGSLQGIDWPERNLIAKIASSHGGKIEGDRDTIRSLPQNSYNGDVLYRPQFLAAILRLADELADESSRADSFGLLSPASLPKTCLLFHKYASALRVSLGTDGRIGLNFALHAEDLRAPFPKIIAGVVRDVFLLDEVYERTLKTYNECQYCMRYLRGIELQYHEVAANIEVYDSPKDHTARQTISYIIGDAHYPISTTADLKTLSRQFASAPSGAALAAALPEKGE